MSEVKGQRDWLAEMRAKKKKKEAEEKAMLGDMQALGKKTRSRGGARKIFRNKDEITNLISSIKSKPKFTRMVNYSLECLKNLAVDTNTAEELIDMGVIEMAKEICKLNPYNEEIMQAVNALLQSIGRTPELQSMVAERMGTKELLFSLNKHKDESTLVSTCQTIAKVAGQAPEVFSTTEVIDGIAHVLNKHPDNSDIVNACTDALTSIAQDKKAANYIATDTKIIQQTLQAVQNFPDNVEIVKSAMSFFDQVSRNSEEATKILQDLDVVAVLAPILEKHHGNKELEELASRCLSNLATSDDLLRALGLINSGQEEDAATAMAQISALALVEQTVMDIINNKAHMDTLMSVLKAAAEDLQNSGTEANVQILDSGLRVLMRLATDDQKIHSIMTNGGVTLCVNAIEIHIEEPTVVASALAALGQMVSRDENAKYIIDCGGLDVCIKGMLRHPDDFSVILGGCKFLEQLSKYDSALGVMVEKSIGALSSALKYLGHEEDICISAMTTLSRFCANPVNFSILSSDIHLWENVIAAAREHVENPVIADLMMTILNDMGEDEAFVEKLVNMGAMTLLLTTMEMHADDVEIQKRGQAVYAKLSNCGKDDMQILLESFEGMLSSADAKSIDEETLDQLAATTNSVTQLCMLEENLEKLVSKNTIGAMLQVLSIAAALPQSSTRDEMQLQALSALIRLAGTEAGREQLLADPTVWQGLMKYVEANPEDEAYAEKLMSLLAATLSSEAIQEGKVTQDMLQTIIDLARKFGDNDTILKLASQIISEVALAGDADLINFLAAQNAAEILVDNIFLNMDDEEALAEALMALEAMMINDDAMKALIEAGAVEALLQIIRDHPDDSDLVEAALAILNKLVNSSHKDQVIEKLTKAAAYSAIIEAVRQHYAEEGLVEAGTSLLAILAEAGGPEALAQLADASVGLVALMEWVAEQYGENELITMHCQTQISSVNGWWEEEEKKAAARLAAITLDDAKAGLFSSNLSMIIGDESECSKALNEMQVLCQGEENAIMLANAGSLKGLAAIIDANSSNMSVLPIAISNFASIASHSTLVSGDGVSTFEDISCIQAFSVILGQYVDGNGNSVGISDVTAILAKYGQINKFQQGTGEALANSGALASLLKIISRGTEMDGDETRQLLANAANVLCRIPNLHNDQVVMDVWGQQQNIAQLIACMRANKENMEFIRHALLLLAKLSGNDTLKTEIGVEGGVELTVELLQMYMDEEAVVENCSYCLDSVAFEHNDNIQRLVECSGCSIVVVGLETHTTPHNCESSFGVISTVCFASQETKQEVLSQGGHVAIVDAMLAHFESADLMSAGFRALGSLSGDQDASAQIIDAGAIQSMVAAMTEHGDNLELVGTAINVIAGLARFADEPHLLQLAAEGGIQAVLEALGTFIENEGVVEVSVECLTQIARFPSSGAQIVAQGGTEVLLSIFESHLARKGLMLRTMRVMHGFDYSKETVIRMQSAQCEAGVLAVLQHHTNEKKLIVAGCLVFQKMARDERRADNMINTGVVEYLLTIFDNMRSSKSILVSVLKALGEICYSKICAFKMAKTAMNLSALCIADYMQVEKIIIAIMIYLANLCVNERAAEECLKTSVVAAMMNVVTTHPIHHKMLGKTMKALKNLALSAQSVKNMMKNAKVVEAMEKVKVDNADHKKTVDGAQQVIDAILIHRKVISRADMKSTKDIFKSTNEDDMAEIDLELRNFLIAGGILMKHNKGGTKKPRHISVSPDLRWVLWRNPVKSKIITRDTNKLKVWSLRHIDTGRCTAELTYKKLGRFTSKKANNFALFFRQRTLSLEADTEQLAKKWVAALEALIRHNRWEKAQEMKFGHDTR